METRLRTAALFSMIAMVSLAGVYINQSAVLPLAEAFGASASASFVGALFGWCLGGALEGAPGGTARQASVRRRYATAAPQA